MGHKMATTDIFRKSFIAIIVLPMVYAAACVMWAQTATAKTETVGVEQFVEIVNSEPAAQILDVRTEQERSREYIKGSISIPFDKLESRVGEIDMSRPVLVYCQTGHRSAAAMKMLSAKSPVHLVELQGGINQFFSMFAAEPEAVKNNPGMKPSFNKARSLLVTRAAVVGLPMPDISFADGKGKTVSKANFKGKPFILAFIVAADIKQADSILKIKDRYTKKKSKIVVVPVVVYQKAEEQKKLTAYLGGKKNKTVFYYDSGANAARRMGLSGVPSFSLVDADGVIRANNISDDTGPVEACGNRTLDEMAEMVASGKLPPYPMSDSELSDMRQKKMVGVAAPDFELTDFNGNKYELSELDSNGALIVFGTLHCPYTLRELETVNSCERTHNGKPVKVLAVLMVPDMQEAQRMKEFIDAKKIKYPLLMDTDGSVFEKYNITSVPVWWIVGEDGIIRHMDVGFSPATCDKVAGVLP
ncbi:MAG: redoxin domain-containing protein [bacterium]